jgi:hypothetical protein
MSTQKLKVHYPAWLPAGVGAIALVALFAEFQEYRLTDAYAHAEQDPYMINAQPDRLRDAVSYLPDRAVVGYLSDLDLGAVAGQSAYFGVMYALAPRLVTRSADDPQWVVGNFSHPLDYAAAGAPHRLDVVKDFGNGIVLFKRRAR